MGKKQSSKKPSQLNIKPKSSFIQDHPVWTFVIAALILLTVFYFQVLFGGKSLVSPDKMTSKATIQFVKHNPYDIDFPLWCPFIFSGMPSYSSMLSIPKIVNPVDGPIRGIIETLKLHHDPNFFFVFINYLLFGLLAFIFLRDQKIGLLPAAFAGIALMFLPQFIAFTSYGHNTKFLSLMLIPLILLLANKLFEKRNLLYFVLLALTLGLQLIRAHVQVCYYTYLMLGIYYLVTVINTYRSSKKVSDILVPAGLLAGVILVAVLLSSIVYISVYDYQHYSIRGSSEGSGLDFDYASGWSFHPLEMVTFIIPSFMGFGGATYWGKMPFTDYPLYFSVLVLFFAGAALVLRRDKNTTFFGILALFSLLVSFGRHFGVLYTPMFKFLPFFNKFRIPSMIHIVLDIAMVILAAYGIQALIDLYNKESNPKKPDPAIGRIKKYFWAYLGVIGLFTLYMLFAHTSFTTMVANSRSHLSAAMREQAYHIALMDSFKSLVLTAIAIGLSVQLVNKKLSISFFGLFMIVLVVADLWMIDYKIMKPQDVVSEESYFNETPAVQYMKKDTDLFRIYPARDDKAANWYMYHNIASIYGYSAAKIRIYQDFLEESGYGTGNSPFIMKYWRNVMRNNRPSMEPVPPEQIDPGRLNFDYAMMDMLNIKYVLSMGLPITDPRFKVATQYPIMYQGQRWNYFVYENTQVLPRAFFADTVTVLNGKKAIFDYMKSGQFNPRKTAILEEAPPMTVFPSAENTAEVTHFDAHNIKIKAQAAKAGVLVLSEVYYPAGWKAYVDGVETKIYKTNYLLRSIFLEPGEHEIEFRFHPDSFFLGMWISVITFVVLLLILAGLGAKYLKNRSKVQA